LTENNSLSNKAQKIFEEVESGQGVIVVPTIVLAELSYICEKKNIEDRFFAIIEKITESTNYMIYNLDLATILECRNIKKIPEMHDKIIVATAKILNASIITKDEEITNSGYAKVIW